MNVLEKALEVMRERGMCKHLQEDAQGHVCLYGALTLAGGGQTMSRDWMKDIRAAEEMDRAALRLFPYRGHGINAADVNNDPATTQEDVELILKHAAYEYGLKYPDEQYIY